MLFLKPNTESIKFTISENFKQAMFVYRLASSQSKWMLYIQGHFIAKFIGDTKGCVLYRGGHYRDVCIIYRWALYTGGYYREVCVI